MKGVGARKGAGSTPGERLQADVALVAQFGVLNQQLVNAHDLRHALGLALALAAAVYRRPAPSALAEICAVVALLHAAFGALDGLGTRRAFSFSLLLGFRCHYDRGGLGDD